MYNKPVERKISEALRLGNALGNVDVGPLSSGNYSVRLDEDKLAIKPSGVRLGELRREDISIVDFNSRLLRGKKPSTDLQVHIKLYQLFEDVGCVAHVHSHHATVFAILGKDIEVLSTFHADHFGKTIPCLPFANHRTRALIELLDKKVSIIRSTNAFLIAKHGAFVIGVDSTAVLERVIALEEVARLNYNAMLLSHMLTPLSKKDAKILHDFYESKYGQR